MIDLGQIIFGIGDYQVFEVLNTENDGAVVGYIVFDPASWTSSVFESLREALEVAYAKARSPESESPA
ncbi:hypothetical protein LVB87_14440 [Lysobacter sp. KIS68-7]|uniref:hypothetical protein n=1 Tax=Lysobacter sp. KIS68-7 TaxID=2904252 RepID=UPI001E3D5DF4|nr:hypothetical protein [Lysobacter sp. KIS68-7]UHQ19366.1 hypothetical protein LVB87_14440 [Lysobacter sp. KIS68-7]